jgi:hypothetical protein
MNPEEIADHSAGLGTVFSLHHAAGVVAMTCQETDRSAPAAARSHPWRFVGSTEIARRHDEGGAVGNDRGPRGVSHR